MKPAAFLLANWKPHTTPRHLPTFLAAGNWSRQVVGSRKCLPTRRAIPGDEMPRPEDDFRQAHPSVDRLTGSWCKSSLHRSINHAGRKPPTALRWSIDRKPLLVHTLQRDCRV